MLSRRPDITTLNIAITTANNVLCDQALPTCARCARLSVSCVYSKTRSGSPHIQYPLPIPINMAAVSEPLRKKRALLIAIQHVHRKARSTFSNLPDLVPSHRDAEALRDLLMGTCFKPLLFDRSHPSQLLMDTRRMMSS